MKSQFVGFLAAVVLYAEADFAAAFRNPYGKLPANPTPGDRMFTNYFRIETTKLSGRCLSDIKTLDDWNAQRPKLRQQLFEMLGLDPLPPRTDLKAKITWKIEHPEIPVA